eukprot:Rhum_TRINITY_DN14852_c6_g1::Rhum_TRINITY_DN14852_c6_g1_i1::g.123393::m.123393
MLPSRVSPRRTTSSCTSHDRGSGGSSGGGGGILHPLSRLLALCLLVCTAYQAAVLSGAVRRDFGTTRPSASSASASASVGILSRRERERTERRARRAASDRLREDAAAPTTPLRLEGIPKRNYTSKHLVVGRYAEDLTWLHTGWGSQYSHTVYEKRGEKPDFSTGFAKVAAADGSRYHLTNFGDEATAYLRFIIDHYDDLPDVTVFLHGTPSDHNAAIHDAVACLKPATWFTFLTRSFVENRCVVDYHNRSMVPNFDKGAFADFWLRFPWADLGLGGLPRCITFYCCAEFAVSRQAIRARPLSFYKEIWSYTLDFVLDENVSRRYQGWALKQIGGFFEHVWHVIFGEPIMMHRYRACDYFTPRCGPCKQQYLLEQSPLPPNHPTQRQLGGLRVMSAFYGYNCDLQVPLERREVPKAAAEVLRVVKAWCDGKDRCTRRVNVTAAAQPTVNGCGRELYVSWMCPGDVPGQPLHEVTLAGEANGRELTLECPQGLSSGAAPSAIPYATACAAAVAAADVPESVLCAETADSCDVLPGAAGAGADAAASCDAFCARLGLTCEEAGAEALAASASAAWHARAGCTPQRKAEYATCGTLRARKARCVCTKRRR